MPNESRTVNETGTYSTYMGKDVIEIIEKLGLQDQGPAKAVKKLARRAEKFEDNKEARRDEMRKLEEEKREIQEMNEWKK